MDPGAPQPPNRSPRSSGNGRSRTVASADPRVETTTSTPAPSPDGPRRARSTKKRAAGVALAEATVLAPDAPATDLDGRIELPDIVPAEPDSPASPPTARTPTLPPLAPTEAVPMVPAPGALDVVTLYDDAEHDVERAVLAAQLEPRAPVSFRSRRPRVRRVTRIIRHVDTWSVFKVALVFSAFFYLVTLTAGVLLWQVAYATGTIDNIEKFFEGFGWSSFQFRGGEIYHNAWIGGLFVAIGLTGLAVLMATLFNLITDLVGGIRVSVLEEEVVARSDRTLFARGKLRTRDEPGYGSESSDPSLPG